MSAISNYLENKLIDFIFRGQSFTPPTTLEFALFTAAPSDSGGGTEVTGGGYARVPVVASLTNFAGTQNTGSTVASSGTTGTTSNNVVIQFPEPTLAWGVATHIGILDSHTGGNLLLWSPLAAPKTINAGDAAPKFNAATFQFILDTN